MNCISFCLSLEDFIIMDVFFNSIGLTIITLNQYRQCHLSCVGQGQPSSETASSAALSTLHVLARETTLSYGLGKSPASKWNITGITLSLMPSRRVNNGFSVLVELSDSYFAKKKKRKLDNYLPKRLGILSLCQIKSMGN